MIQVPYDELEYKKTYYIEFLGKRPGTSGKQIGVFMNLAEPHEGVIKAVFHELRDLPNAKLPSGIYQIPMMRPSTNEFSVRSTRFYLPRMEEINEEFRKTALETVLKQKTGDPGFKWGGNKRKSNRKRTKNKNIKKRKHKKTRKVKN
jgi:hypothetical protein